MLLLNEREYMKALREKQAAGNPRMLTQTQSKQEDDVMRSRIRKAATPKNTMVLLGTVFHIWEE